MVYFFNILLVSFSSLSLAGGLSAEVEQPDPEVVHVGNMPLTIDVDTTPDQAGGQKIKLVHVAELGDAKSNDEFKRNVAIMQRHQESIQALQRTIQTVEDEELKLKLEEELEKVVGRLNSDNKKMVEAYGFSLTRRYEQIVEKSHIYMYVTEEEAAGYIENVKKKRAADSTN